MRFIKKWICKIFKLGKIAVEYEKYVNTCEALKHDYEFAKAIIESYKREIAELREIYADPISYVENALKESREAYEKCVVDMEELLAKQDRLEHKAYARGRSDAYAEMGIKALDARLNGETLCVDENDNVVIVENVDVFDGESFEEFCAKENLDPNEFENVEVR